MKRMVAMLFAALLLCACEDAPAVSQESAQETFAESACETSAESERSCVHEYGGEPTETVGNLEIYECVHCGERKVVAQGTLIGGNEE